MRRVIASMLLVQVACSVSVPIPEGELDEIAREVSKVGHPAARYEGARLAKLAAATDSHPAYVDIEIDYVALLAKKTQTMTVRFEVQSMDPCKVRTDVVGDTGEPGRLHPARTLGWRGTEHSPALPDAEGALVGSGDGAHGRAGRRLLEQAGTAGHEVEQQKG